MKYLASTFLLLCLGIVTYVFAGAGHDHGHDHNSHTHSPISEAEALNKAKGKIQQLINKSKIAGSWSRVTDIEVQQKSFGKGPEWVVSFKNENIKDKSKQTLYLFYSLDGHYIAANYTGN